MGYPCELSRIGPAVWIFLAVWIIRVDLVGLSGWVFLAVWATLVGWVVLLGGVGMDLRIG